MLGLAPEGLQISQVTVSTWTEVLGKQLFRIEEAAFPHALADTASDLKELVRFQGAIFIVARMDNVVVGYASGAGLESFTDVPGVTRDLHFGLKDTFYLESVAVLPSYQRRGIGKQLLRSMIVRARKRGFEYIAGHMKEGCAEKWRGVPLAQFENYYDTGETFEYFRRELKPGDWAEGCKSLISVQGIFAGFASVVLVALLEMPLTPRGETFPITVAAIIASLMAIVLLIYSAERSTDAVDHVDPVVYTNMLLFYNIGVTFFFVAIGLTVSLYLTNLWLNGVIPQSYLVSLIIIWLAIGLSLRNWIKDIIWLSNKSNRRRYPLSFECEEEN